MISDSTRRKRRRENLITALSVAAQTLCDSHKREQQDEVLERMLRYINLLLPRDKLNDKQRKRMAAAFEECAGVANVRVEDKDIELEGWFKTDELHKRFVLIDPEPVLRDIGGANG